MLAAWRAGLVALFEQRDEMPTDGLASLSLLGGVVWQSAHRLGQATSGSEVAINRRPRARCVVTPGYCGVSRQLLKERESFRAGPRPMRLYVPDHGRKNYQILYIYTIGRRMLRALTS